ncbi:MULTISPECIES: transcriptional regulator VisN [Rhizobium]|uniref:Helix-turn-helix transcriptional regulator n=1 Tax=Rhizobium rhododendri TaxID=2506430 RepID=A0ABY8IJD2_9HYPH|nr:MULTISPECIES: helix-turn-helix transcriptional regulator [Rhizobium]MBZ5760365.1 helix-turn-helix transcriptional regulator [Rhizobium sp. VS19-DR96]MBZ5766791.1 helix-turn-helix transcriptional regulator [Rhizobium sp. VS19-DR129.2]MBZ5773216.1 helix-turn-helix transcriptional regulator [Rhizobium sp. VS19-DRK62.2]MBZ5784200.1 helix-turn-helix transcriptional regulator [Rhizobium sp. VS19-DR121]MBZ5802560.1 helix-turn-helix transcriptional regulator [Rhizobium sp. VS19-DR181]
MDMNILQASRSEGDVILPTLPAKSMTRDQLILRLMDVAGSPYIHSGLRALTDYIGASHYMLARCDLLQESGLDFVMSSDWPFDLVRRLASHLVGAYVRTTEIEKCMLLFQPSFSVLPDDVTLPEGSSRQYCSLTLNVGRTRLSLMLLYRDGFILSPERLREVGLLTAYFASFGHCVEGKGERSFELTDRELECLFWIAEGKTSDEIAMILGISRNTINNYITSVMRKTATKTRSEAIAFAVRNNLV